MDSEAIQVAWCTMVMVMWVEQVVVVTVPLVRKGLALALARELVEREDTEVVELGRWPFAPWPGDQGEQGGAAAGPAGQAPQLQLALHLRLFQALTF